MCKALACCGANVQVATVGCVEVAGGDAGSGAVAEVVGGLNSVFSSLGTT